mmetsp:Transcript_76911/g.249196  ORF Transcript_76911/g.249196 Transcript_76911/m.249196 type:complete len:180 (+) Transcript_76911:196-735(+)
MPARLVPSPWNQESAVERAGQPEGSCDQRAPARQQGEGTPAQSPTASLVGSSKSAGDVAGVRVRHLMLPGCEPTSDVAREFSLITAMRAWNTVVPPLACCRFHACVKELRMSAKRLERRKCPQNFRLIAEAQCSKCGTLYAWDADEENEDKDDKLEPAYCVCCSGCYIQQIVSLCRESL